jgi:hypothetical protein
MNKKIAILSLLILAATALSGCSQGGAAASGSNVPSPVENSKPKAEKIEVMNFHATQRCASCSTLGKYSEETINEFFQPELRDGIIRFQSVNVDLPENREVAKKYQAAGSSLFINAIYGGQDHIEQDAKVWRLLGSEQQFKSYLKDKINGLLNK